MNKKNQIKFIKGIVEDLGNVQLSAKCGKYYSIIYDGKSFVVLSFKGKYGYDQTNLEKLGKEEINSIYNDLKEDFG